MTTMSRSRIVAYPRTARHLSNAWGAYCPEQPELEAVYAGTEEGAMHKFAQVHGLLMGEPTATQNAIRDAEIECVLERLRSARETLMRDATAPVARSPRDVWTAKAERSAEDGLKWAQELAFNTASEAGWHDEPRDMAVSIALMHSELSEALEADRKNLMDDKLPHRKGVEVEFADAIIRILDTAQEHGLDVAGALIEKNRFNKHRSDHKRENRAAANGKRY